MTPWRRMESVTAALQQFDGEADELLAAGEGARSGARRRSAPRRARRHRSRLSEQVRQSAAQRRFLLSHDTAPACTLSSRRSISPARAR